MKKQEVVEYFGGVTKTAQALDISRQAVSKWPEIVPKSSAYRVQVVTGGRFKVRAACYPKEARS